MWRLTQDVDRPSRLAAWDASIRFWAGPQWRGAATGALYGWGFGCMGKRNSPKALHCLGD